MKLVITHKDKEYEAAFINFDVQTVIVKGNVLNMDAPQDKKIYTRFTFDEISKMELKEQ